MTMHSSLRRAGKSRKFRCVLSRTERIKWLKEKGQWNDDHSVVGLPKIKVIKMKASKKEKPKDEKKDEKQEASGPKTE